MIPLVLVGIGAISGILAGLVGIGGGAVTGGLLILLFQSLKINPELLVQLAFGTSHFVILFTSALAAYRHNRNRNLLWRAAIPLGGFSVMGAVLGARVASVTPGALLKSLLGVVILLLNFRLFFPLHEARFRPRFSLSYLGPIGLGVGFVASLLGIGGGVISIPIMVLILGYPMKLVAGTSSGAICFTALAACLSYIGFGWQRAGLPPYSLGYLHLPSALPILLGSLFGVQIGVWLHGRAKPRTLQIATAAILTVIALRLLVS